MKPALVREGATRTYMVLSRPERRSTEIADCMHTVQSGYRLIVNLSMGDMSCKDAVVLLRAIVIEGFGYGQNLFAADRSPILPVSLGSQCAHHYIA